MRKNWEEPVILAEKFTPNDYVASCSDGHTQKMYKFVCDAPAGETDAVYLETNGEPGLQDDLNYMWNPDQNLGGYGPCGETHIAPATDAFLDGYIYNFLTGKTTKVIVWRGEEGNNTHCTTALDITEWETEKS